MLVGRDDFDAGTLLRHRVQLVVLNLVVQGQLYDLAVLNVVVVPSVVLEHCRVTRHNLEIVVVFRLLLDRAFLVCLQRWAIWLFELE